jgi:hypothetical protein
MIFSAWVGNPDSGTEIIPEKLHIWDLHSIILNEKIWKLGMSTFRFFVIENNSCFALVHEKTNISLFFTHSLRQFWMFLFCFAYAHTYAWTKRNILFRYPIET